MTRHQWGVTYMIRDVAMASDMGGNCLAVSRDSRNRDAAADFLKFLVNEENSRDFIKQAMLLPVRRSLMAERIEYPMRADAMQVFINQVPTIQESFARAITIPEWSRINQRLADELDLCFTTGQSPEVTARNAEAHARAAFAG
jgi:ABC-type glycerol-3-phosphate transport system substrate-binding protein